MAWLHFLCIAEKDSLNTLPEADKTLRGEKQSVGGKEVMDKFCLFSEKAKNKRIGSTQTATWRAVLSERVMTARLFYPFCC